MKRKLIIEYAVDEEGKLINIKEVEKKKSYFCPKCKNKLSLRKKESEQYFYHEKSDECDKEKAVIETAKLFIMDRIIEWQQGKLEYIEIERKCGSCNSNIFQTLPSKITEVRIDYTTKAGNYFDIVFLEKEEIIAGCKIVLCEDSYYFHYEDERIEESIKYFIVDAVTVINNSKKLIPLEDNFKKVVCLNCKLEYRKFMKEAERISRNTKVQLPKKDFRYGITNCWKCGKEILVFTWERDEIFSEKLSNLEEKPRTIEYRYSKTMDSKYWVNTCPNCKNIQGDFFLHSEIGGPFLGIECTDDFEYDMIRIASNDTNFDEDGTCL